MSDKNEKKINESILEDYIKTGKFGSKSWRAIVIVMFFVFFVFLYKFGILDKAMSADELKTSLKISEVSSKWIVKKRIKSDKFKGIILVPQITFRIKNSGIRDLKHLFFLGVFRFVNSPSVMGEGSAFALEEPLKPGEVSKLIELASQYGYTAASEQAFAENPRAWEMAYVEIFTRSSGSDLLFLKSFYISRKIEGLDIDIKVLKPVKKR